MPVALPLVQSVDTNQMQFISGRVCKKSVGYVHVGVIQGDIMNAVRRVLRINGRKKRLCEESVKRTCDDDACVSCTVNEKQ